MNNWLQQYLLAALRIDRAYKAGGQGWVIDTFYGPPALQQQVAAEPALPAYQLVQQVDALATTLAQQAFAAPRAAFLARQVQAMSTLAHKLAGRQIPLSEEVQGCLDIAPKWLPETQFELALALYDEALPGSGDLRRRYRDWQQRTTIPALDASALEDLLRLILAELRRRTQALVALPADETIEARTVQEKPYGAANWYLGGYRSRLELNLDRAVSLSGLLYLLCHEGYPGHHTEYTLKEQRLYHEQGYAEHAVFFISPQLVIAEGIASTAMDHIFSSEEAAAWASQHLYAPFNIPLTDVDLPQLYQAAAISCLDDLAGNVAMLLSEGHTQQQVVEYVLQYTLEPEENVRQWVQGLQPPLMQIYAFSYAAGRRLLQPAAQGRRHPALFKRMLTEQLYPSLLSA